MSSIEIELPASGGSGGGVTSLNTLTGAVTLAAGSGISITPSGNTLTIAATGAGSGTVTTVSVVTANGVSGSVANPTSTPAITLTLGAITPSSVVASGIGSFSQIGIGTSSPASGTSIDIVNQTGAVQRIVQTGYGNFVGLRGRYANGTLGSPTAAVNGNILSFISGQGYGATAFPAASTGVVNISATGTFTDTSMPTSVSILTTPSGSVTAVTSLLVSATGQLSLPAFYTSAGILHNDSSGNVTSSAVSLTADVSGILPIANGGTNKSSVTVAPAATSWAGWDANKNLSANNFINGYTTIATAAGTTTLVVGSTYQQYFTGSTTQTVLLPVTSTLILGQQFFIRNNSTGVVTVQSSGGNTIQSMGPSSELLVTVILTTGTGTASWDAIYVSANQDIASITLAIDGGGSTITTGIKADVFVPYSGTLQSVTMLADQTGSIVVDIWKVAYASYPATVSNTITASALPTITTAVKSQDNTLTGWTTTVNAGDTLRYNVNSATSITRLNMVLKILKN